MRAKAAAAARTFTCIVGTQKPAHRIMQAIQNTQHSTQFEYIRNKKKSVCPHIKSLAEREVFTQMRYVVSVLNMAGVHREKNARSICVVYHHHCICIFYVCRYLCCYNSSYRVTLHTLSAKYSARERELDDITPDMRHHIWMGWVGRICGVVLLCRK